MARTNQLLSNLGIQANRAYAPSNGTSSYNGTNFNLMNEEPNRGGGFRLGQGNSLMQGINKTAGELLTGEKGSTLINSDLLKGGGKTLGAISDSVGLTDLGNALSETPFLNGNVPGMIQEGLTGLGNLMGADTAIGAGLGELGAGISGIMEGGSAAGLLDMLGNAIWALL